MIDLTRRSVLFGLLAAPIVVRSGILMPVKALRVPNGYELLATVQPEDFANRAVIAALWQDLIWTRWVDVAPSQFGGGLVTV